MSLENLVQQNIDKLPVGDEERRKADFIDPETGTTVHLLLDHVEKLGCHVWEVNVTRPTASHVLMPWAKRVADEVTGLLEPLKVVEVDEAHGKALLRSDEPKVTSEDLFYYEVALEKSGSASVRRYRGAKQPIKREQVGFTITREALAKLVVDLAM